MPTFYEAKKSIVYDCEALIMRANQLRRLIDDLDTEWVNESLEKEFKNLQYWMDSIENTLIKMR